MIEALSMIMVSQRVEGRSKKTVRQTRRGAPSPQDAESGKTNDRGTAGNQAADILRNAPYRRHALDPRTI